MAVLPSDPHFAVRSWPPRHNNAEGSTDNHADDDDDDDDNDDESDEDDDDADDGDVGHADDDDVARYENPKH